MTAQGEVWEPTLGLRWLHKTLQNGHAMTLEQWWFTRSTGKGEWREIPVEHVVVKDPPLVFEER